MDMNKAATILKERFGKKDNEVFVGDGKIVVYIGNARLVTYEIVSPEKRFIVTRIMSKIKPFATKREEGKFLREFVMEPKGKTNECLHFLLSGPMLMVQDWVQNEEDIPSVYDELVAQVEKWSKVYPNIVLE